MSIVPRAVKVFLFMLGILICIAINSRDRFDNIQLIVLLTITALFTFGTWVFHRIESIVRHVLTSFRLDV